MKKLIVGVAAALSFMTSNAVADGPYRRPPPRIAAPEPPPPPSWTGFYIGVGIGHGSVVHRGHVHDHLFDQRMHEFDGGDHGVFGTVTVGWDWQIAPRWVFGVLADYDFTDHSSHHRVFDDFRHSHHHNDVWAVGARLGWLSSPSVLWYVTGGYTQVDHEHHARFFDSDDFDDRRNRNLDGFFVGGGVETRLVASNWFLRLEYRFSDFNSHRLHIRDEDDNVRFHVHSDPEVHSTRLTLTYKFVGGYGWSGWGMGQ